MLQSFCDWCKEVIKPNDTKILVAFREVPNNLDPSARQRQIKQFLKDFFSSDTAYNDKSMYEICKGCKEVLKFIISLRIADLRELQNKIQEMTDTNDNKKIIKQLRSDVKKLKNELDTKESKKGEENAKN